MIFRTIVLAAFVASASAQGCSVCGEGKKVTTPDAVFNLPGQPAVGCGLLESSGCMGLVPLDQCAQLSAIISAFGCGCGDGDACATAADPTAAPVSSAPVTDPTPAPIVDPTPSPVVDPTPAPVVDPTPAPVVDPTPAPVVDPTPAPVVDPTPAPVDVGVSCPEDVLECPDGSFVIRDPMNDCDYPACQDTGDSGGDGGGDGGGDMGDMEDGGGDGGGDEGGDDGSDFDNVSCSVCGDGKNVTDPDAIFTFPGQPAAACGILETSGNLGLIPSFECSQLPELITDTCKCEESGNSGDDGGDSGAPVPDPTPAPVPAPVPDPTPAPVPDSTVSTLAPVFKFTNAPVPAPTPAPARNYSYSGKKGKKSGYR